MSDGTARDAVIYHHPQEHNPEFLGAIERIVKGLYYKDYTKVLIEHYEISVFQPDAIHHTLQKEIIERISETQIYSVNSNTIQYMFFNCQVSDVVCAIKLFNSF